MKKLLSIMLAAFMVMGMFSVVALADADITISTADELISWAADSDANTGKTVVLITHNSAFTAIADRVIHVREGRAADIQVNAHPVSADTLEW